MDAALSATLFAYSGPGAGAAMGRNIVLSLGLLAVNAALAYFSVQRQRVTPGPAIWPAGCLLLLVIHPAWTVSATGDEGGGPKLVTSVIATGIAVILLLGQWLAGADLMHGGAPPEPRPTPGGDTRLYPGEPPVGGAYAVSLPDASSPGSDVEQGIGRRLLTGVRRRLFPAACVGLFALAQYARCVGQRELSHAIKPDWVLGPLYFLANASPADDWIGYALLAVAVPCLLAVVVWPNRWTALVASLTALAWVVPGYFDE